MARVTVTVRPRAGLSLRDLLLEQGVPVRSDCGGRGTCGKCLLDIRDGAGTKPVLACRFVPEVPVSVEDRRVPRRRVRSVPTDPDLRLAADFGTTTISLAAVDVIRGTVRARVDALNPQVVFGADVMTRIAHARTVKKLDLLGPVREFMRGHGIGFRHGAVAVGNTAMAHFLLGQSPAGLATYPYRSRLPVRSPLVGRPAWKPGFPVWVPPLLDSFVGADCTAAIVASGMHRRRGLELLVDAGTNGELALGNRERVLVCSTAAGPAFEGATLECGSLARAGAVTAVAPAGRGFRVRTVGNRPAQTVCGSGVLSAVAAALHARRLGPDGRIRSGRQLVLSRRPHDVYLSQADIREVQFARAALVSGIRLLLAAWGARARDIDRIHLTGRFGAAVEPADAARVGLIPDLPDAVRRHGNLALKGAMRMTHDRSARGEAIRVARLSKVVVLSGHSDFESIFVSSLELAPWLS